MQAGQKQIEHYFQNVGGLNLTDSPFVVKPSQATGGQNFEYVRTGGIQKSLSPSRMNSVADAQLRTLGLFLRNTQTSTKSIIRAAGQKIQLTDLAGTFANLTEDTTAAGSDFLAAGTDQPVVGSMTTGPVDVLWLAGGGMSGLYGVPSDSKVTANGVPVPTGAVGVSVQSGGGSFSTAGTYFYAISYRKRSTGALSNSALDVSATLAAPSDSVALSFSGLTNLDKEKYDKIYVYRSAVGGVSAFTTGSLVAQLDSTATTYLDKGAALTTAENIARPGNLILDNSALPAGGSYKTLTLWKNRLVTASGSTLYISDINKFESFPLANTITVPSGGEITGLAIISFTTPSATTTDEFLLVFKEKELHVVTGNDLSDWSRKFVDNTGCLAQSLIISANGYIYFIDNRGVYLFDGAGKPVYISRPIEDLFGVSGTLDRSKLRIGFGAFFEQQNQAVWCLSNSDVGEQTYLLKLDLRMTLPSVSNTLGQRILDGVFLQGKTANPSYAGATFVFPTSSNQETVFLTGDNSGYLYRQFYSSEGVGPADNDFAYESPYLDQGKPGFAKRYEKVIAWVENVGNWDLVLDYWTEYRNGDTEKHSVAVTINSASDGTTALWDVAKWDEASWDSYKAKPKSLTFNLSSAPFNNAEGDVIKLRFRNAGSNQPVTLYGFSVLYSDIALRK